MDAVSGALTKCERYIEHMLHTDVQPIYVREKIYHYHVSFNFNELCCVKKSLFSFIYENVCF